MDLRSISSRKKDVLKNSVLWSSLSIMNANNILALQQTSRTIMTTVNPSSNINSQEGTDDSTLPVNKSNNSNSANNGEKTSKKPSSEFDIRLATGIFQPKKISPLDINVYILNKFEKVFGVANISADPRKNEHFRTGWRSGEGTALAVIFPQTLEQL